MTTVNGTPTPDALRELVREVLRDVLPALAARNGSPSAATPASPSALSSEPPVPSSSASLGGPLPTTQPVSAMPPAVPTMPPTSDPPPSGPAGLPETAARSAAMTGAAGAYETTSGVTLQPVRLATDEDLHKFVLQVVRLADNPKRRRDLVAGRLRFTLAAAGPGPAPPGLVRGSAPSGSGPASSGPGPAHARGLWSANGRRSTPVAADGGLSGASGGDHRIERGAVTERAVQAAASAGARLVLGPRAVLTPLARDRARALGVPIEKER
jgi:hypothetical protein